MSKTIIKTGHSEVVEKRSGFLGQASYAATAEEALEVYANIKKKYYDAKHHVYAYICDSGASKRSIDDGEPSGTAGRPLLDILEGNDMVNCVLVVTRYFGGTLLGTGGLLRAYSKAGKLALEDAGMRTVFYGRYLRVKIPYASLDIFKNLIDRLASLGNVVIEGIDYLDECAVKLACEEDLVDSLLAEIEKLFLGSISPAVSDKVLIGI